MISSAIAIAVEKMHLCYIGTKNITTSPIKSAKLNDNHINPLGDFKEHLFLEMRHQSVRCLYNHMLNTH